MLRHCFTLLLCFLLTACSSGQKLSVPLISPEASDFGLNHKYDVRSSQFRQIVGHLMGPQIIPGNTVTPLQNGDEIFPAMLAAIKGARESITFETFIYWDGQVGKRFADALAEKAREGVTVNVILDWFGSKTFMKSYFKKIESAGVNVKLYNALDWYNPAGWFTKLPDSDSRTHRKLLVIDGRIGFIGGVGIADNWLGNAQSPEHWRDNHYRVTGPVVAQMQSAFVDNWLESGGDILDDRKYFPELKETGETDAQIFKASPYETTALIELIYRIAITAAEKNIRIGSAYFVPNEGTSKALLEAVERGVRIEVILPERHNDSYMVKTAARYVYDDLIAGGVEIFEYLPTMYHNKVLIVDDYFVSVGSANFDNRSFRINDEANINVFETEFADKMVLEFEADKSKSRRITEKTMDAKPLFDRFFGMFAWLLRSKL